MQVDSKSLTIGQRAKIAQPTVDILLRPGCYSLIIDLKWKKTIRVGKLGEAVFPAGTYVYTGSAMKGLGARLRVNATITIHSQSLLYQYGCILTSHSGSVA